MPVLVWVELVLCATLAGSVIARRFGYRGL
jgi:hypothetical protein